MKGCPHPGPSPLNLGARANGPLSPTLSPSEGEREKILGHSHPGRRSLHSLALGYYRAAPLGR